MSLTSAFWPWMIYLHSSESKRNPQGQGKEDMKRYERLWGKYTAGGIIKPHDNYKHLSSHLHHAYMHARITHREFFVLSYSSVHLPHFPCSRLISSICHGFCVCIRLQFVCDVGSLHIWPHKALWFSVHSSGTTVLCFLKFSMENLNELQLDEGVLWRLSGIPSPVDCDWSMWLMWHCGDTNISKKHSVGQNQGVQNVQISILTQTRKILIFIEKSCIMYYSSSYAV